MLSGTGAFFEPPGASELQPDTRTRLKKSPYDTFVQLVGRMTREVPADALKEPMYGTRRWCLVQAITRHTCPDPHLGSWNCLPLQAHIAPSEPMSSIDQQGSSLDSFPTFASSFYPHFNRTFGLFDHVSSRVWWEAATNNRWDEWQIPTWPDHRDSCKLSEFSWTIWLLFCDPALPLSFPQQMFFAYFCSNL